jgi:hypothetical protein
MKCANSPVYRYALATLISSFPKFSPRNGFKKARGAFSNPSTIIANSGFYVTRDKPARIGQKRTLPNAIVGCFA